MLRSILRNLALVSGLCAPAAAQSLPVLEVHIDADYSISPHAAMAIEKGFASAFSETDFEAGGAKLKLVRRDHRANVKRSRAHMEDFLESPYAIAMVGGLHSPPYLTHRDFINENGVLFLLPWSAAGPITRGSFNDQNWMFRLSVDDTKAGEYLVTRAMDQSGCENLSLVLIDTGWGRANFTTLSRALNARGKMPASTHFFDVSIGRSTAKTLAENLRRHNADCAVLLADWDNGAMLVNAFSELPDNLRVFSHWGVMGGPFDSHVDHATRERVSLEILQTCGLGREKQQAPELINALAQAPDAPRALAEIPASAGFVHGYDLGRIFVSAIRQASQTELWGGSIHQKRNALRKSLEALEAPVDGVLKTYVAPFAQFGPDAPDAHEALGSKDLCMARFAAAGHLIHAE